MIRNACLSLFFALSCACSQPKENTPGFVDAEALVKDSAVQKVFQELDHRYEDFICDLVQLTEIPAPSQGEAERAAVVKARFQELGLSAVRIDKAGNVIGERAGNETGPNLLITAHLDTVFPAGTDVRVQKKGTIYSAPGIGDNAQGLAALIAFARALYAHQTPTNGSIIFAATTGEEQDLRGMRHMLADRAMRTRIHGVIVLDYKDDYTVNNVAVGKRSFTVTYRGPGGHAFEYAGSVNPTFALASTIAMLGRLNVTDNPKTAINVSKLTSNPGAGTIPEYASMEVSLRSASERQIDQLEERMRSMAAAGVMAENTVRSLAHGKISVDITQNSSFPAGITPVNSPLVTLALSVTSALGRQPELGARSSDANIAMHYSIPAIMIGAGRSEGAHTLNDTINVDKAAALPGQQRLAAITLGFVGIKK